VDCYIYAAASVTLAWKLTKI